MKENEILKGLVIEKMNEVSNEKYFSEYIPIDASAVNPAPHTNFGQQPDSFLIFG